MIITDIKRSYSEMKSAERRVADFVIAQPSKVTQMSMAELSAITETSDATVMRMCRRIGQKGFYQLKINLAIESGGNTDANTKPLPEGADPNIATLIDSVASSVTQLAQDIPMDDIERVVDLLASSGRVLTFGWGNMNSVAEDLALRLLRFGISTFTSTSMEYMLRSIALAGKDDTLVVFSRSGESIYATECCKLAKMTGLNVVLITADSHSSAAKHASIVLKVNPIDDIMSGWGESSHCYEIILVDILLYFLKQKASSYGLGTKTEAILAQFKS